MKKAIVGPGLMLTHLKTLAPIMSANPVAPVLAYLKLSFDKQKLTITGTNFNHFIIIETNCENKNPFDILVPYVKFKEVCDKEHGAITIEEQEAQIVMTGDGSKHKIQKTFPATDFPAIPLDEFHTTISVTGDFFYALSTANACKAKEDSLTHMCNPAFDFSGKKVRVVGMSQVIGFYSEFDIDAKYTGVHMVTGEFVSIVKEFQDSEISIGTNFVMAKYKETTVISKMSANPFVSYREFMPKTRPKPNMSVNKSDFISAVGVVGVSENKSTNQVLCRFNGSDLTLQANDPMGDSESEKVITFNNMDVSIDAIGLAGRYLLTILNRMLGEGIDLYIEAPNKQVYIMPEDEKESIYFIQPMVINN